MGVKQLITYSTVPTHTKYLNKIGFNKTVDNKFILKLNKNFSLKNFINFAL